MAATHNSTAVEDACIGELLPGAYVAAVLNLTVPVDFVLGNGMRGQGYHNAALHPGWDYTALLRLVRHSQQVAVVGKGRAPALLGRCHLGPGPLVGSGPAAKSNWQCRWGSTASPDTESPGTLAGQGPWGPQPQLGHLMAVGAGPLLSGRAEGQERPEVSFSSPATGRDVHLHLLQLLCW